MAPGPIVGNSFLSKAVLIASAISSLDRPARTNSVFLTVMGTLNRAAGGLKQIGPRILGFQNTGSSTPAVHPRSTMHTKPFLPFTATSYPCRPITITSASAEMDGGAALSANAISALRSIMYCSTGAIFGYGVVFASSAFACQTAPATTTSTQLLNAMALRASHFDFI